MKRIGKPIAAAALLAAASSAGAVDVPTALERIERHYLCRAQACFDPLASYDNAANRQLQISQGSWTAPSGLRCVYGVNSTCATFTANKIALKAALKLTVDDELVYLVGNRMRPGSLAYNTSTAPFVIKEVLVTDTSVVLYGGDRPLQPWGFSSTDGVSIYP